MSFSRQRFLGLTVVDFQSNVGWNEEGSSIRIRLAPEDGESLSGDVGSLEQFTMGGFTFNGFVERIVERHDSGGNFYEVVLNDGKDLLRGVECVVNSLYGSTDAGDDCAGVKGTFLNVFRFFERNSFGASGADESGMLVGKFLEGVRGCIAQCGGINGYGLSFNLPIGDLPESYRIPGPTINLMDAIGSICDDLGLLWRIKLVGTTFNIVTVSIKDDAANNVGGTIKSRVGNNKVISWDYGKEMTNNIGNNLVVFGGPKENTVVYTRGNYSDASVSQFWGYDITGDALYGPDNWQSKTYTNKSGNSFTILDTSYKLPVIGLEDIFGGTTYSFTAVQLAFVMGGQESFEFFLELYEGGLYQTIFLRSPRNWDGEKLKWLNYGGAGVWPLKRDFSEKENDVGVKRFARVYAYLRNMCETYWGKQYLVQFNNINGGFSGANNNIGVNKVGGLTTRGKIERRPKTQINESEDETYNAIPSNTGWWEPTAGKPFPDVPDPVWNGAFKDPNGKMYCWFEFPINREAVTVDDSGPDCFLFGSKCFIKGTVSEKYVNKTHVHVSLAQTPFETFKYEGSYAQTGNATLVYNFFGLFTPLILGQSLLLKCGYYPYPPSRAFVGFKAINNDVYGPWYKNNGATSTKIQIDQSLNPWTFGGGQNLAKAFETIVSDDMTIKKSIETGSYTVVESPTIGLGSELGGTGGAICSSVSSNYGPNGITTTYSFRTFVPKFGVTSRYILEKMKRLSIKQSEDRRNIYKTYMDTIAKQQASFRSEMGAKIASFFLDFLGRRHDRMSPHSLISMGIGWVPAGYYEQYARTKTLGASYKNDEALKDISNPYDVFFAEENKACASLDAIFSPYRNTLAYQGFLPPISPVIHSGSLRCPFTAYPPPEIYDYKNLDIDSRFGKTPTARTYNPLKRFGHIDTLLHPSVDNYDHHNEPDRYGGIGFEGAQVVNARSIALNGPIMLSGWGVNLWTGEITPAASYGLTIRYGDSKYASAAPWEGSEFKNTGPVDLVWDASRGVWTSHDVVRIRPHYSKIPRTSPTFNPRQNISRSYVSVYSDMKAETRSQYQVEVFNLSGKDQPKGLETLAYYSVFDNRWYVKGEGCHLRFWDNITRDSAYEALLEAGAKPEDIGPFYWDFDIVENIQGDPRTEKTIDPKTGEEIRIPVQYCTDFVTTHGMSAPVVIKEQDITCPNQSKVKQYTYLWFWHGLAKEIKTTQEPCPTDPPNPDPSTTTSDPNSDGCYLYKDPDGCHFCSTARIGIGAIELVDPNPFSTCEDCQGVVPSYNEDSTCHCYLIKYTNSEGATECYKCSQNVGGGESKVDTFYGPTACEDCAGVLPSYNVDCSTTTTTVAPLCYLFKKHDEDCWQCSQNQPVDSEGDGEYPTCEECDIVAKARNKDIPGCPTTTSTTLPPNTCWIFTNANDCWVCSQGPTDPEGNALDTDLLDGFPDCKECDKEANDRNKDLEGCNTTTTSTTTTPPPPTTTSTTLPPNCVSVVTSVTCNADGNIETTKTLVQACATQQPLVAQSNVMEVRLLRAELKAVTRKLMDVIDALSKNNIKVFK